VPLPELNLSLVPRTQDSVHAAHQLRKSHGLPAAPLSVATFLLSSLLPSFLASVTTRHGICFPGDGLRTNRPYLSAPKNLGESWFAFPGTKILLQEFCQRNQIEFFHYHGAVFLLCSNLGLEIFSPRLQLYVLHTSH
jgi:hypothetical protein